MREKYTGLQFTRDFYHNCKMGKPKDELQQHLTSWQEEHPEMGIVINPDLEHTKSDIGVNNPLQDMPDLEFTEADSSAVPLIEKPVEVPKTGVELAKLIVIFEAEGKDVLPIVKEAERLWRKDGEK